MTPRQEELIITSSGIRFTLDDTLPVLFHMDEKYKVDRFSIRGESTLRYRRKSFSINLDDNMLFFIEREGREREIEEFKLISLVFDYTYIENCIALGLFRRLDLWPTHSLFTEVRLNDHTQGVYLFIEDPVEYYLYNEGADFILRRNYNHIIDNWHINEMQEVQPANYYTGKFLSIYSIIAEYSGEALYDSLKNIVDLDQYFTKMSIDLLLQNGDYTDEIFFYYKKTSEWEGFGVHPWDYDDIFASSPHEIGRNWGPGTVFGVRNYSSMDDIIADVGVKLIYSIEDDLDYIIARDDFLYQRYLSVLENVFNIIDELTLEQIFAETKEQLQFFYNNDQIIAQSQYDQKPTDQDLFDDNLVNKKQLLIDRRNWIIEMISNQKK